MHFDNLEINSIIERFKKIKLSSLPQNEDSLKLWQAYTTICKKTYIPSEKILSESHKERVRQLKQNAHIVATSKNCSLEKKYLLPLFEQIEHEWLNPSPTLIRSKIENTTVNSEAKIMRNLMFCAHTSQLHLHNIKQFLIESGIKNIVEHYYSSNCGVANVRLCRFSHNPAEVNTHIDEEFDLDSEGNLAYNINLHADYGLPREVIKVFIYKSANKKNIILNKSHGLTELKHKLPRHQMPWEYWQWISAVGKEITCMVFNSNWLQHRAIRPSKAHDRDSIEITILPKIENDFPIIQAGNMAGMCKNPFMSWEK